MDKIKNLAVLLLEDEDGIHSDVYYALLDTMQMQEAMALNLRVKATDGRFYLPEGHDLQGWRS